MNYLPKPCQLIRSVDELKRFLYANDAGFTKVEISSGCQVLLEYFEKIEKYEYCIVIRDFLEEMSVNC